MMLNRSYNRLFTFGCSFTKYFWPLWPEILADELQIPLYNFGRCGAGNQYIFNMLMQADNVYNFNENDLVIISWTNMSREDRYRKRNRFQERYGWSTPGNIFSQVTYPRSFVTRWADLVGYALRDFATIKSTSIFLKSKKCQHSMLAMCDITKIIDQWNSIAIPQEILLLADLYKPYLDEINPSFYDVLWNGDIQQKIKIEQSRFSNGFNDGHPTPVECLRYLETTYNYQFQEDTRLVVGKNQQILDENIRNCKSYDSEILRSKSDIIFEKSRFEMVIDHKIFT